MLASRRHRATHAGSASRFTPSASRTFAEPLARVLVRFPCLATFTPAPATTSDVVVEMVCHQIDVWNWLFKTTPVRALAAGGINQFVGQPPGRTIVDHMAFIIEYPDARVSHTLTLYAGVHSGIKDRIMCADGAAEIEALLRTWTASLVGLTKGVTRIRTTSLLRKCRRIDPALAAVVLAS